jgi:Leucine-rich repeat (LRR) protein
MSIRFTSLLRDLIVESSRFQVLFDKFVKPKDKTQKGAMPFETLFAIIAADPTSNFPDGMDIDNVKPQDMDRVKIGKYTQWLLKNFVTPILPEDHPLRVLDTRSSQYKAALKQFQDLFMEDLYKVTGDLKKYERFKNRLPQELRDINKLTPETLYDNVKDFSLEKTKATKDEKKEASKTYQHPGADIVYRGPDWTVAKISDTGQLGKDAACFYGGSYQEEAKGETRWCTSSPGLTWFDRYIKDGPLYVVIPNKGQKHRGDKEYGDISGLPALRYQFHFPSGQYMDPSDRQINLVDFLNTNEEGLKQFFKPEFMKSLAGPKGDKIIIDYPNDSSSKFVALYGFDELFSTLPQNLKRFTFKNTSRGDGINLNIPKEISRFKDLQALNFVNCITSLPEEICNLTNLQYLSLVDNKNLQRLPECIGDMPNLMVLNIPGAENKNILPESVIRRAKEDEDFNLFV